MCVGYSNTSHTIQCVALFYELGKSGRESLCFFGIVFITFLHYFLCFYNTFSHSI